MREFVHNNFIGVYDNFFSEVSCDSLINFFEHSIQTNRVWGRNNQSLNLQVKDFSTLATPLEPIELTLTNFPMKGVIEEFNKVFWDECYKIYCSEYEILNQYEKHTVRDYKLQKTKPSGGYHIWHSEGAGPLISKRFATYILYLNDVDAGGETEFLYQSIRLPPKKGRLCIFPASYTHTHRGNPPLSGDKYIMTGWIEFT